MFAVQEALDIGCSGVLVPKQVDNAVGARTERGSRRWPEGGADIQPEGVVIRMLRSRRMVRRDGAQLPRAAPKVDNCNPAHAAEAGDGWDQGPFDQNAYNMVALSGSGYVQQVASAPR